MNRTAVAILSFLMVAVLACHPGSPVHAAAGRKTLGPRLIAAVEKNDLAAAEALLARGADPNSRTPDGRTAVMLAAVQKNREMVRALLARGARVNDKDSTDMTPLLYALGLTENSGVATDLLDRGAAVNVRDKTGHTPLTLAVSTGNLEIVPALLKKGAPVDAKGRDDETPLLAAARAGNTELVKLFLARGANVNARSHVGETALMSAARNGKEEMGRLLFARGADARAVNSERRTPLMLAAEAGSAALVRDLLAAGADVNARDRSGKSALMGAGGGGAAGIMQALMENGSEVNARDGFGCTALMRAALRGNLAAVQALLESGADPNARDHRGRTAWMRAAAMGSAGIVEALRARGATDDAAAGDARVTYIRGAVQASLPLLQTSAATFQKRVGGTCYSCHHQSLPAMAVAAARAGGIPVDEEQARNQFEFVAGLVRKGSVTAARTLKNPKDRAAAEELMRQHFPGGDIHAGYGLLGLAAWDRKTDASTETVALVLAHRQRKDGRWGSECRIRPPAESSDVTATALVVRALRDFAPKERAAFVAPRIARAREWLARTPPQNTEERTFRLLGLVWAGATKEDRYVRETFQALLADQREDGGWGQTPAMGSDAYATGEVLVALHQAGGLPTSDSVYQRGVTFLLRTQEEDGSWFVKSRAVPFQGYIETGFPYGKDQFISATATSWATMALALAAPPVE